MGVILAFATAVSFSVMNLAIRKAGQAYPGENGVLTTVVVNVIAFSVLWLAAAGSGTLQPTGLEAAAVFASIGITGPFLGRTFLFAGIDRIGVVRASAIKSAAPIITLLMAVLLIGERFTVLGSAGIGLILAGVFIVVRESLVGARVPSLATAAGAAAAAAGESLSTAESDRHHVAGVVLAMLAAVAFGASNGLSKVGLNLVPDAIQAGFFAAWAALALYVAWAAIRGRLRELGPALRLRRRWFWLAGLVGTAGQLTFFAALHFIDVGPATVVAASEIVLTTALGAMLAQRLELVTHRIAIPALLVFAGAALIALSR
jgi:drug/metabolite transporter (DMT)-like permease